MITYRNVRRSRVLTIHPQRLAGQLVYLSSKSFQWEPVPPLNCGRWHRHHAGAALIGR
jgi:hypothetical protein